MNTKKDEALALSNPRLLSAAYFGLLAVILTVTIDAILYGAGIQRILPTFQALLLATATASCFGAIFGEWIVYCAKPYRSKTFLLGFTMVLAALPVYDLIFSYLLHKYHPLVFENLNFISIVMTYFLIVLYSFLAVGIWLAIAAGFAAMYLRGHLVYDILHSKSEKLKSMRSHDAAANDHEAASAKVEERTKHTK